MKIYARQIAPEYQESPLFLGEGFAPDEIIIAGNDRLCGIRVDELQRIDDALENIVEEWDDMQRGAGYYSTWADALRDMIPPEGRADYTRDERKRWRAIAEEFERGDERDARCDALTLQTGHRWGCVQISGCCQGDWNVLYYPEDAWTREGIKALEAEYFNTGSEWIVHDGETPPEGPEDVNGFSIYCTSDNSDGIRAEIASETGCDAADVILYRFSGYERRATYRTEAAQC